MTSDYLMRRATRCEREAIKCHQERISSTTRLLTVSILVGLYWAIKGGWLLGVAFFAALIGTLYLFLWSTRLIRGWLALKKGWEAEAAKMKRIIDKK
jgi:hypothetical protein